MRTNRRASGPVFLSGFLIILAHSAVYTQLFIIPDPLQPLPDFFLILFFVCFMLFSSHITPRIFFSKFVFSFLSVENIYCLLALFFFSKTKHRFLWTIHTLQLCWTSLICWWLKSDLSLFHTPKFTKRCQDCHPDFLFFSGRERKREKSH